MAELLCMCGGVILIIIVHIALAIWVYRDAENRGEKGVLWLLVFLVAGIIGLIIWLIVRPPKRTVSDHEFDDSFKGDQKYRF